MEYREVTDAMIDWGKVPKQEGGFLKILFLVIWYYLKHSLITGRNFFVVCTKEKGYPFCVTCLLFSEKEAQ